MSGSSFVSGLFGRISKPSGGDNRREGTQCAKARGRGVSWIRNREPLSFNWILWILWEKSNTIHEKGRSLGRRPL